MYIILWFLCFVSNHKPWAFVIISYCSQLSEKEKWYKSVKRFLRWISWVHWGIFCICMYISEYIYLWIHVCISLWCRLNSEESIQMVTALALQLIQCVIKLPTSATLTEPVGEEEAPSTSSSSSKKGHKSKRGQVRHLLQDLFVRLSFL